MRTADIFVQPEAPQLQRGRSEPPASEALPRDFTQITLLSPPISMTAREFRLSG
jgi:hypothetical protein